MEINCFVIHKYLKKNYIYLNDETKMDDLMYKLIFQSKFENVFFYYKRYRFYFGS